MGKTIGQGMTKGLQAGYFETLVDQAPTAIFIQMGGNIAYLNQAALNLLGVKDPAEVLGQPVLERIHPDARAQVLDRMRLLNQETQSVPLAEETFLRMDGSTLQVEVAATPITLEGEKGALVFANDISQRKQAEQNYHNLFNSMLSGMALHEIICDEEGQPVNYRFLSVNPAFEALTGLKAADIVGKTVLDVLPSIERSWIERYGQVALTGEPAFFENYTKPLGKYFEVNAFSPAPGQFAAIFADVSARRQAENIIRARLRLMEYANSHSLDEVLVKTLDEVCEITDSPIGFYHFVEADQETLSLQAWSTHTQAEYCRAEGKGLHYPISEAGVWVDAVRARKAVIHNDYASLPHKRGLPEGHASLVRELAAPILRNDNVVAILGVGNKPSDYNEKDSELVWYFADVAWEIAIRKQAEEGQARHTEDLETAVRARTHELREAQEKLMQQERLAALGQVAGGLSNELRNPLAVIRNAVYYLRMVQPDADEKIKQYHNYIEDETQRAEKFINSLLDFSRQAPARREKLDLEALARQALKRQPGPEGLRGSLSAPAELPAAMGDEEQVRQILDHLIENAWQAISKPEGKVTLECGTRDDMIWLSIADNGEGIAPKNLARLFEPLFTTRPGGTGMGLAISKKLAESNHGRIEVRSQPGQGSIFTLFLPVWTN